MKLHDFQRFLQEAEELYRKNPLSCRYTIKDSLKADRLVLKVTDNRQVRHRLFRMGDGE